MAYSDFFPSKTVLRADIDANDSETGTKTAWNGVWDDTLTYNLNDMVRDGDWTMIANTITNDRAAPQEIGIPEDDVEDVIFNDIIGPTEVVKMIHEYTMIKNGWLQELLIKTPNWDLDSVSKVVLINTTTGKTTIFNNPILASDAWVSLVTSPTLALVGEVWRVEFYFYNSTQSSSINGIWNSVIGGIGTVPSVGEVVYDDEINPTFFSYNYEDLDGTLRTELDGVIIDSIININETGSTDRFIEAKVTAIDNTPVWGVTYTVTTISSNREVRDDKVTTNSIDIPITIPTHYFEALGYRPTNNPTWATITSELYFNEVNQVVSNSAFGIDVKFQEGLVSPDWDLISLNSGVGSGTVSLGSYDFAKFNTFTTILDTFTEVGRLVTPSRPKGTYEVKLSMTWNYSQSTSSAVFRWSMDGGAIWDELIAEPKDSANNQAQYYAYPVIENVDFVKTIIVEARSEVAGATLNIPFLDIMYERKL